MSREFYVNCIVEGMELYFRSFALAGNMHLHKGDIEWITPLPNTSGPSLVFKVSLDEKIAFTQIDELMPGLKSGTVPSLWVLSPTSAPKNIVECLLSKGFKDLSNPDHPELGMALDIETVPNIATNPSVKIEKISSLNEFGKWINVVNDALHGWDLLNIEHYSPWLLSDDMTFYLAYLNDIPVSTVATVQYGDKASIEFMSTSKEYRNQGIATAICSAALRDLQENHVKIVTLRSSNEAVPLYKKLGFKSYYELSIISYKTN